MVHHLRTTTSSLEMAVDMVVNPLDRLFESILTNEEMQQSNDLLTAMLAVAGVTERDQSKPDRPGNRHPQTPTNRDTNP